MDFGGRREIFRALVGSHNYNLNTPESDKDYKVFMIPTFDDLYTGNQFSKAYIGKESDYDCHDIRKVSSLWWKANVNFLEVLFSSDIEISYPLLDGRSYALLSKIFSMKSDIAKMNLPYLYDACVGMHLNKKKLINKGTEGTQHLVDKFGMDTKQCMHSIRILDFLKRFADNDFTDFKKAIWYGNNDGNREYLLDIKNGIFTKEEYYEIAEETLDTIEIFYHDKYKSQPVDNETNEKLLGIVKEIVRINL